MDFTYELVVDGQVRGIMKIHMGPCGAGLSIEGDVQARLVENEVPEPEPIMPPILRQRFQPPRLN